MRLMYTKKECLREHKYSIKCRAIKYISLFCGISAINIHKFYFDSIILRYISWD